MLHSSERSKATDTNIDRLLKYIPNFDNVWLSKKLMKSTEDYTTW